MEAFGKIWLGAKPRKRSRFNGSSEGAEATSNVQISGGAAVCCICLLEQWIITINFNSIYTLFAVDIGA